MAEATRFAKLGRPTISAWAVNQLWWHARDAFDALFETAARLRKGDLHATSRMADQAASPIAPQVLGRRCRTRANRLRRRIRA